MAEDIVLTNAIARIKESADIIYNVINADEDFSVDVENGTLLSLLALQKRVTDQTDIVNQTLEDTIASLSFRSEWTASTAYNAEDFVRVGQIMYMALTTHTSHVSDFNTDLTAGKWIIYAPTDASFMKYEGVSLPEIFKRSFYITTTIAAAKLINTTNFKYIFIKETGGFYEWNATSSAIADNSTIITPTANIGGNGRFLVLSVLTPHNNLSGRSSTGAHPSEAISHGTGTAKTVLDDYQSHKQNENTAHGATSEAQTTKIVKRDGNSYSKVKTPTDYTDVNNSEDYIITIKTARSIRSVIDAHINRNTATASNPIHGSTSLNVVSKLVHRDENGRAEVANALLTKPKQIVNVELFKAVKDSHEAHIDTDSTDEPHGATPDLTNDALVRRDSSGTAKFGAPTEDEHPIRKVDLETLPQLVAICRFDGDGDSLTYRGDYSYSNDYNLNDTVRDPDTGLYYACIQSYDSEDEFDYTYNIDANNRSTVPPNRHIGDSELDIVNSNSIINGVAGDTWDLRDTYSGTVWSNKYNDSRHQYHADEPVRVVINEGQTPANGYLGADIELDISSQKGVLFDINTGGDDGGGQLVLLGDIRAYYEATLAISPASSTIAHVNIYTGIRVPVADFDINVGDDIIVQVVINGTHVTLPDTYWEINDSDNSVMILPDNVLNASLNNFLQGTNVAQGTYAIQREIAVHIDVIQRTFRLGTFADTLWTLITDPTGLVFKAQNNMSVVRDSRGEYILTIGSDTGLSGYMVNVFLPSQTYNKADEKEEYNVYIDYTYGDSNQVKIFTFENGNDRDLNNIQVSVYK